MQTFEIDGTETFLQNSGIMKQDFFILGDYSQNSKNSRSNF